MRGGVGVTVGAALATVAALAVGQAFAARGAATSDIYITGTVTQRVSGKNAALVRIAWDYKCLGENGGSYEWTLKVVRESPLPRTAQPLGSGTSERGARTTQLTPGRYLPLADPYFCETDRGQGYDKPEIGAPFTVPDYCAWTVTSVRGLVQHEHGTAVKAARRGSSVAAGDALVTPRSGGARLAAPAGEGQATLEGVSRLALDRTHCPRAPGWKLHLEAGKLTAAVSPGAPAKASFSTVTPSATVSGGPGARWRVELQGRRTKVRALAGQVRVAGKTLRPGQTATV